jgi:hypothetical protein
MQLELPDLREAIIAHDSFDEPAESSSWAASAEAHMRTSGPGDSGTFCPTNLWRARPPTTSRSAASAKGLSNLYDGLRAPSECDAGARTPLAEIAAFPDGKHDDQVDVLSEGHLRGPSLGPQARPNRATAKVQIVSPK